MMVKTMMGIISFEGEPIPLIDCDDEDCNGQDCDPNGNGAVCIQGLCDETACGDGK